MATTGFFGLDVDVPVAVDVLLVAALTCIAGVMAGLLLCAFALDVNRLRATASRTNTHEAAMARRVLLMVERPHWLLITLLIWNDVALEMMPIVLHMFLNPFIAIVTSVVITLVFCEIIPEAVFIHHSLTVCAYLGPFVYGLMLLTSPVSWPISKLLDRYVGDKVAVYLKRRELTELIRYQDALREQKRRHACEDESNNNNNNNSSSGGGSDAGGGGADAAAVAATAAANDDSDDSDDSDDDDDLTREEVTIMLNILSLSESTARSMLHTPVDALYRLHVDAVVTDAVVDAVFANGYDFVAVYDDVDDATQVTSVLMTKALLLLVYRDRGEGIRVRDLPVMPLEHVAATTSGTEVFVMLQRLSPAIAAVVDDDTQRVLGLLTLRNVTELVHETTFSAEMDPHNESPMQRIVRSWRVVRRVEAYALDLHSRCPTPTLAAPNSSSSAAAASASDADAALDSHSATHGGSNALPPPSPPVTQSTTAVSSTCTSPSA